MAQNTPNGPKYTKWPKIHQMAKNTPNGQKYTKWPKIHQMAKNTESGHNLYTANSRRIFQPLPFQGPPKFTQIGIFGMKIHIWQPCSCIEPWPRNRSNSFAFDRK
jgi:hypothetical protein